MEEKIISIILKEAKKGAKKKNIPVGAAIVCGDKIIAKAHNDRYEKTDVTNHAEIIAIRKASKKKRDWRLNDCDLYVTLEPCDMCMEVIKEARIRNVFFLTLKTDNKKRFYKTCCSPIDSNKFVSERAQYCLDLSNFFELNCNR